MANEITIQPGDKIVADQWDTDFTLKSTPDSNDTILGSDSTTGNPCKFKMSDIQANSATNILGVAHPTDSPTGTEVNGQGYDVSNTKAVPDPDDGSNDDTYTNFLTNVPDGSGGFLPVVVPASTSGVIRKSGGSWEFVPNAVDLSGLTPNGGFEGTSKDINDVLSVTNSKVDSVTEESPNLIDKMQVIGASYNALAGQSGNPVPSANWISYPLIPCLPGDVFSIIGRDDFSVSGSAFTWVDDAHLVIGSENSNGQTSQTSSAAPANTAFVGVKIANETGIGNTPTDNQFSDTVMLVKSATIPTEYAPYGYSVKSDKVLGLGAAISANETVAGNKSFIDAVRVKYSQLNNKLNNRSGVIEADGDNVASGNWCSTGLEPCEPGKTYTSSGHVRGSDSPNLAWAWYDIDKVFISGVSMVGGQSEYTVTAPANAYWRANTIANIIDAGVTPSDNAGANSFMVNEGAEALPWEPYPSGENTNLVEWDAIAHKPDIKTYYPKKLVTIKPYTDAYAGVHIKETIATIYEHIGAGYYAGHNLFYEHLEYADYTSVDGDYHGGKNVRYGGANLYSYNPTSGAMTIVAGATLVLSLESEFVFNASGWVCGYHGNEWMLFVYFLINGVILNPGGQIDGFDGVTLKECESFSYVTKTQLFKDTDHSLMFDRVKINEFEDGGYAVETHLKDSRPLVDGAKTTQTIGIMYPGICCLAKYLGNRILADTGNIYIPVNDGNFLIDNDYEPKRLMYSNDVNSISASVETEIIKSVTPLDTYKRLWDRAGNADTKNYDALDNVAFQQGDEFKSRMKVTIEVQPN